MGSAIPEPWMAGFDAVIVADCDVVLKSLEI